MVTLKMSAPITRIFVEGNGSLLFDIGTGASGHAGASASNVRLHAAMHLAPELFDWS
jgi:hypothetical protein